MRPSAGIRKCVCFGPFYASKHFSSKELKINAPNSFLQNEQKFFYLILDFSARRANFFSAVRKILHLVSVFRNAKKWAQNRKSNQIFPSIEDIVRWMSKNHTMEWSDSCKTLGFVDGCWNHWVRWGLYAFWLRMLTEASVKMTSQLHQKNCHKHVFLSLAFKSILLLGLSS